MKLPLASLFSLACLVSSVLAQDTVQVSVGWNNIGSLRTGAVPEILTTVPPGIITASFYGYIPGLGYSSADTLRKGQGYWVKANSIGSIIFSSPGGPSCPETLAYAGRTYNTVLIGMQCWLRENLDVGMMVSGSQNQTNNNTIEKYCYDDGPANCSRYGALYQWDEAMQYATIDGAQGICPPGWHVPTLADFQALSSTVGGDGNALKAIGQGTGDGRGTNTSGFSALLAGARDDNGSFTNLASSGYFLSSTQSNAPAAHGLYLFGSSASSALAQSFKIYGFSVRCLQD